MSFKWELKAVKVKDIKLNPDNPKIRNEKGFERLRKSLEKFGHIFDGIANTDLTLVDGHSRIELMKPTDTAKIFVPDKKLTKKQFRELAAVYDISTAGDPDFEIIHELLGDDGMSEWELDLYSDNDQDFSTKNKELNINEIDDRMILNLTFDENTYYKVIKRLNDNGETFEDGLLNILGL